MGTSSCMGCGQMTQSSLCSSCAEFEVHLEDARAVALGEAMTDERIRCTTWVREMILEPLKAGEAAAERRTQGGQQVGPSSNPWAHVPKGARLQIERELRYLIDRLYCGAPVPRKPA